MKLLITGGHGYIGQYLCRYFENEDVIGTSRTPKTSKERFMQLLDETSIQNVCSGVDIVIHTASMNERQIAGNEKDALLANAFAARQLYLDAVRHGAQHFIYLSTFHVYGRAEGTITEETYPVPKNDYGLTHLAAEQYLRQLSSKHHVPVTILRLTNGIGLPGEGCDKWYLALNDFCAMAAETGRVTLLSDGMARRDFLSIYDVCRAVDIVIKNGGKEDCSIYNVSAQKTYSIRELAELAADLFWKLKHKKVLVEIPQNDNSNNYQKNKKDSRNVPELFVESAKLRSLGWEPVQSVEEVAAEIISSFGQGRSEDVFNRTARVGRSFFDSSVYGI